MPRSAGGIDDVESEDSVRAACRFGPIEHRIERAVEQRLYQAIGRVVAAGNFSRVPPRFRAAGEGEGAAMVLAHRHEFEQPLINRTQFLGRHVAPVDSDTTIIVQQPAQLEDRRHEGAIRKLGIIQIWRQPTGKETPERRQAQHFFSAFQRAKNDLCAFPGVGVMIVGRPADRPVAQMREAVAIKIERMHRRGSTGG